MYIPNQFHFKDEAEKVAFMKRYSFATIITANDHIPIATQLPFFIGDSKGQVILSSHFAIANKQAQYIEEQISLVIFSQPHAYISPGHYDKPESVPTWDYIAVHAYGKAKIIEDEDSKMKVLEEMIAFYDQNYLKQWNSLSDKFKNGMMKGIIAFELEVTELQGQKKLSQNKTEAERYRIAEHLEKSENAVENDLASYIRKL
jgi:transcriptional regulator